MTITITAINATFGAVVTDVDLAKLGDETWSEIHTAFLEYGVLVFPGQHLDDEAQGAFASRFGNIEQFSPQQTGSNIHISNQKPDGSLAQPDEQQFHILRGNEGWHTDSTYMPLASKAALLAAMVLPPEGGETDFADMRAAWDELDEETQARLEELSAYHSLYYSQEQAGYHYKTDNMYGFHDKGTPLRPIVKTHPDTGRKSIYTGRHAYGIPGMNAEESEVLLKELLENACRPPRTYRHVWQLGDLVVWDNRCLMHRARPYDTSCARVLRGTRISGEPETELAPTFADKRADGFQPAT
ncbi:MAG: TauD/TfdA family dioxygenase [Pseudomonadales bacterium]|jgi:alpha-ketoglutarate-dependent taurine dioxygenase|nr:TauD/TfdA family dioxygenase [Pseudomonadales bacterium]MDP7357709.1 TauD/TfdA family dioxygenase [Pseudomonadales bacterium]MDP7596154.1 TauD/TfdA family dioxygenase [Pseudomonadales bacterium]HJN50411.1 TauD/TfdA family dioxygenase [Pseudomonadales bacterium]|tara:strand:- start:15538 stop:16434 length:897 start_codon:yes stop_codon:yes gene_type:complete